MPTGGSMNALTLAANAGTNQQLGGMDMNKLLAGILGGGAAMSPLGLIASAGGPVLDFLGGLFGGKSDIEKLQEEEIRKRMKGRDNVAGLIQNRLGQGAENPMKYLAEYERALAPRHNQIAEGLNARLGLDSGVAQGELARTRQSDISNFYLQQVQSEKGRQDNYLSNLASLYGG